jgi:hypothetical protein
VGVGIVIHRLAHRLAGRQDFRFGDGAVSAPGWVKRSPHRRVLVAGRQPSFWLLALLRMVSHPSVRGRIVPMVAALAKPT